MAPSSIFHLHLHLKYLVFRTVACFVFCRFWVTLRCWGSLGGSGARRAVRNASRTDKAHVRAQFAVHDLDRGFASAVLSKSESDVLSLKLSKRCEVTRHFLLFLTIRLPPVCARVLRVRHDARRLLPHARRLVTCAATRLAIGRLRRDPSTVLRSLSTSRVFGMCRTIGRRRT